MTEYYWGLQSQLIAGGTGRTARIEKLFEVSNHLRNLLVTITDRRIQGSINDTVNYCKVDITSANDYYPFGMVMPSRTFTATNDYRYGFNGKEKDKSISIGDLDFGARIYDGRLGKWLSLDPLQAKFPSFSPYNYCYNNPVNIFDPDGKLGIHVDVKYNRETGKYTLFKVTIDNDLKERVIDPHEHRIGIDWYDYIEFNTIDEKGAVVNSNYQLLNFRTNTWVLGKWWAKAKLNDNYGGVMWTSEDQTSGSEETRKGSPSFMSNIDGLLAMVEGGKELGHHEFEKKDLTEIFEKIAKLIKESGKPNVGDNVDKDDPEQKKIFDELDAILAKYKDKDAPATSTNNLKVKPPPVRDSRIAPPSRVLRDPNTGRAYRWSDSTVENIPSKDSKDPDTIRTTKYKLPQNRLGQH